MTTQVKFHERAYVHEGCLFIFRDMFVGDRRICVQYARPKLEGREGTVTMEWVECPEGAAFGSVEPFITRSDLDPSHFALQEKYYQKAKSLFQKKGR